MQVHIAKWGNSLALRLPSPVARETGLTEGSMVKVEVQGDGSLRITPLRQRFDLTALLADLPAGSGEVDWGEVKGAEAW